jgi:hypothetical protein
MPLEKIGETTKIRFCRDPEHHPPNMIVLEPGVYKHTCPTCGQSMTFTVPERPTLWLERNHPLGTE